MRLIFMGTPEFAAPTLRALLDSAHEVVAVYTQPPRRANRGQLETPSPIHLLAREKNIPVHTPASLKELPEQNIFADYQADAAIVAAYGMLLPVPILEAPRYGCINIHPSKLPRWRGAAPIQRTIIAGDMETSVCIMQMAAGLDTGDILLQHYYPILPSTTSGELHDFLAKESAVLLLQALDLIAANKIFPQPQSSEGITYAKKITKEEALIDWSKPADEIVNLIHGLNPAPGAYFIHNNERIKIWKAQKSSTRSSTPGTLHLSPFSISCADGSILPTLLQREGKKAMPPEEFLKGFTLQPKP